MVFAKKYLEMAFFYDDKKLIEKMNMYKEYLKGLENFQSEFLNIGDGFAVTRKKTN